MTGDSPATGWSSIDALADVARLYPEGVAVPVFAGRIVWPDHRDPTVEDFGDVHSNAGRGIADGLHMDGRLLQRGQPDADLGGAAVHLP